MFRRYHSVSLPTLLLAASICASAQNYTISTIAGQGASLGDGGPAANARFGSVSAVAASRDGTLYIADSAFHHVRKVSPDGTISLFAGSAVRGFGGDGGPATAAMLDTPTALVVDGGGSVYIGDSGNHRVRVVGPFGNIKTFAGNGQLAPAPSVASVLPGEGGPATAAPLNTIAGLAIATNGDLLIADSGNNRVFRVAQGGNIQTVAGNATAPASLADQKALAATLDGPSGITADLLGNIFFSEPKAGVVLKVDGSGNMTRFIGTGNPTDNPIASGSPLSYPLSQPSSLATDGNENIYIVESNRISVYTPPNYASGSLSSIQAVSGLSGITPRAVTIDGNGNVYFADSSQSIDFRNRVRMITATGATTYAGGALPTTSQLYFPRAIAVDPTRSTVYIADTANSRVATITPDGKLSTLTSTSAPPTGIALDSTGAVYTSDSTGIRKGGATVVDGLKQAGSLAIDGQGNIYVDQLAQVSQFSATTQLLTAVAGTGTPGFSGDNGPANAAQIDSTAGVAIDATGNLYIADGVNGRIRKVDASGNITTIAGGGTSLADGAAATDAALNMPLGLAFDSAGNLLVAEYGGNRIRTIDTTGHIRTIAGNGLQGFSGDGGLSTNASLNGPTDVKVDAQGNIYIADSLNSAIRKLTPAATNPTPAITKVSNAASFVTGPVAPGERVILTGSVLGPNATVQFDNVAAPVLSSSLTSTMVVVPYEVSGRTSSQITVTTAGITSAPFPVQVAASAPGIYTQTGDGVGQAFAFGSDGVLDTPDHPVLAGNIVRVLCTGAGLLNPAVATGVPIPVSTPSPVLPVTATLDGQTVSIDQAYSTPGTIGQFAVDVRIPDQMPSTSSASLQIMVGTAASQFASIAVLGAPDSDGGDPGPGDPGPGDPGTGDPGSGSTDPGVTPQLLKSRHSRRALPPLR